MTRTAPRTSLIGAVVDGKYRVVSVIGQGGMGTVFEAQHLSIGRMVALKVLKPENAQKPDAVARLRHEARVVSQLGHPNICEVFDIGQLEDGTPYLVMERLRGQTLTQRTEAGPQLSVAEVVEIGVQVLAGLDTAHRRNVIHRDMKPDNIFLAERASGMVAKILDFGISKATVPEEQPHHLTRTGMVMGTPYYMAPEQAMGERALDGRVDVWGTGVCLFEALTGARPFVAKNYNALLVQILTAPLPNILELRRDVPPGLATVIAHALEKRRENRYQSARELADGLMPFRRSRLPARKSSAPPQRQVPATPAVPRSPLLQQARTQHARPELPQVPVFSENDSSFTSSDEEPTNQLPANSLARVESELLESDSSDSSSRQTLVNEETPTMEENELTIVDPPPFFDAEQDGLPTRRRP